MRATNLPNQLRIIKCFTLIITPLVFQVHDLSISFSESGNSQLLLDRFWRALKISFVRSTEKLIFIQALISKAGFNQITFILYTFMSAKKVAYSPSYQPNLVFVKILCIVPKERTTRETVKTHQE